ncbi:hypothetical protein DID88_002538 [Monilinia fructigena]|uniref:Uncharacterized protein n=1 Tax=Monilinia fructigena TaxID=38457 RepID=A0A395IPH5_9HELO|nr:hypothetical protein DID88_002538 [Monilinia fructigena]
MISTEIKQYAGNQPRQLTKPYPQPGTPCRADEITNHTIGEYCVICTRMKMPWGGFLPIARYQNLPVSLGHAGTILQAVHVDNSREIALLAMATWAIVTNQWKNALKMNRGIERERIKAAAHALTEIASIAAENPEFSDLRWWDILQEALKDPTLTIAAYKSRICGPVPGQSLLKEESKGSAKSSKSTVLPNENEEQEQDDEGLGYEDSDDITEGKKLLFLSRNEADEEDQDEIADVKKERQMSPWQFAPGQDLDPAYWATPDTSKFFMVRQLRKDPGKINVREYPHIAGFDWNDKEAVRALNRGRNQIILRTNVILGLKNGYTKNNMPWEQVAHNINVDLEKVTQRKGSLLARISKWNSKIKKEDFQTKRHLTMQKDRTGSERNPSGCMNQATKFGDLDALLRNSVEQPRKRKPLDEMIKIVSACQAFNAFPEACLVPSITKSVKLQAESNEESSITQAINKKQMEDGERSSTTQAVGMKPECRGGSSEDEPSSLQCDKMKTASTDGSSDDEPLMKRRQSYHAANNSSVNEPPVKRRKSEHYQSAQATSTTKA